MDVLRTDPEQAAQRLLSLRPELRSATALALDDWVFCVKDPQLKERLRRVAGDVDDDPWRRRFRAARDRKALEILEEETLNAEAPVVSLVLLGSALEAQGAKEAAVRVLRRAVQLYPADFWAHFVLEDLLDRRTGSRREPVEEQESIEVRVGHLRAAVAARPQAASAHINLGNALSDKRDLDGAIIAYRKATELDAKSPVAHNNLGVALSDKRDLEGAIAAFHKAIELDSTIGASYNNLGNALRARGDLEGAIAAFGRAIELAPWHTDPIYNLGQALHAKGDVQGAIDAFRVTVKRDPKDAKAYYNLGYALKATGDVEGAIAACRKVIELDPKYAAAYSNLGVALRAKRDLEGAIAAYRAAIELEPKDATAHDNLGNALLDKGDVEGAIASYRKAIELNPKYATAYYNLGNALYDKRDLEEAVGAFRKAIELDPKYAQAHCNLGLALRDQGQFPDALAALRRGHELGSQHRGWRNPSAQWVRETERLVELDAKLPAVLKGELQPTASERLQFAQVCQFKKLYAGAARLYADAFVVDPKLADDLNAAHRYNAACNAALAGCGQGGDAAKLDEKARAGWRKQALDWLRADLKAWTALLERNPQTKDATAKTLTHWQTDPDLAGVRDEPALVRLPPDEQSAWRPLWADVTALRKRSQQPTDVKPPK